MIGQDPAQELRGELAAERLQRQQAEQEIARLRAAEQAREDGNIACQAGRALEENPHQDVELAAAWASGWVATDVVWCLSHLQREAMRVSRELEASCRRVADLEQQLEHERAERHAAANESQLVVAKAHRRAQELEQQLSQALEALQSEERAQELTNTSDDEAAILAATSRADNLRRAILGTGPTERLPS